MNQGLFFLVRLLDIDSIGSVAARLQNKLGVPFCADAGGDYRGECFGLRVVLKVLGGSGNSRLFELSGSDAHRDATTLLVDNDLSAWLCETLAVVDRQGWYVPQEMPALRIGEAAEGDRDAQ